jgi:hypothetical protein
MMGLLTEAHGRGVFASRPAAGHAGREYYSTDTAVTYRDNGSSWDAQSTSATRASLGLDTTDSPQFAGINLGHASDTTLARVSAGVVSIEGTNIVKAGAATGSGLTMATARLLGRSTASTGAIEEITVGTGLSLSAGALTATGGSSASDPVADMFGTPDHAFEFSATGFTGLTSEGTVTAEDSHTTIPDHYYLKPGTNWSGRSYTPAGMPWTSITCLSSFSGRANYATAGLLVGVASLGAFEVIGLGNGSVIGLEIQKFSNLTTYASSPATAALGSTFPYVWVPFYFGIVANSSSSVDFYASKDGRVWIQLLAAHNPSFTVAKTGLVGKVDGGSFATSAFEYLRVWDSAKTFQT